MQKELLAEGIAVMSWSSKCRHRKSFQFHHKVSYQEAFLKENIRLKWSSYSFTVRVKTICKMARSQGTEFIRTKQKFGASAHIDFRDGKGITHFL